MPRILFVCLHRPDRSPSQRYRFEQYLPWLKEHGYDLDYSYLLNAKDDKKFYAPGHYFAKFGILLKSIGRRVRETFFARRPDIVYVQRECFMLGTAFFEKRFARRSRMIFDFDDSIWLQNVSAGNKKLGFLKNPDKTKEIIRASHLVVAGNRYLADYALQFNKSVMIVPTTIDTDLYSVRPVQEGGTVVIGWSGSFSTIQHFEYALEALKRIKEKYGERVAFLVIGDKNYRNDTLCITGKAWNSATEVSDLQGMDIGIMPLPDDEWAKGKCGLKGLQYMAAGIPAIMSPVGVNSEIIQDGENGFLAGDTDEWVSKLSQLIDSAELRRKFSANGRRTVEEKYSLKANRDLYLEMMRRAIKQ